jgi:sugar lactone lactonase YvrE
MRGWRLLTLSLGVASCSDAAKPQPACSGVCVQARLTTLDLLAGLPGGPGWVDGSLSVAHLVDPWAITSDGHGHLYVADGETIRTVDMAKGTVTTLAGVFRQVGGTDGVGEGATFNTPSGLAFANGQLYLTDTENHTIRKIDVQSRTVTTIAGAHQPGAVDASGANARFQEPEGCALDANGNLYIGDTDNNTIRVLAIGSGAVTTLAGTAGMSGTADGVGPAALFNKPKALTLDAAGNLYVIDAVNQTIRKVEIATRTVSTLTTFHTLPQGLVVDGSDVLVALGDDTVVRVAPDGSITAVAGSSGMGGFVDGAGSVARFKSPAGLFNDGAGTVYLADEGNTVVRAIALAGPTVSTYVGAYSPGSTNGSGAKARFFAPQGLAADAHTVYVADTSNSILRKIVAATGVVTTLAGVAGQTGTADGAAGDARFNQPEGLALDTAAQRLYVADAQNRNIRRVDLSTGQVSTLTYAVAAGDTFGGFNTPTGLALDQGRLFVTDYGANVVISIDLQKAQLSTLAGNAMTPSSIDGAGVSAGFYGPLGIAPDGHGHLFVADNLNHTLRKIAIADSTVSTLAGEPQIQGNSDGVGPAAHFRYPTGVAADSAGDVFVGDSSNTVRRVDASSGAVTTIIGNSSGQGVRLGPLPAQIALPAALALTPTGGLLLVTENAVLLAH